MDDTLLEPTYHDAHHGAQLLCHGELGHVVLCGCGHVHLTLQALTLRLEADAFDALVSMLLVARTRLHRSDTAEPRPAVQ